MDLQIEAVKVQDPVSYLHALSKEPREWRELPALRRRIGYDLTPAQQQAIKPQARALAQRPNILSALFSLCAHKKRAEQAEVQYTSILTIDAGDTAAAEALQALFQKVVFAEAIYVGRSEWVARCSNPTQLSTDIVQQRRRGRRPRLAAGGAALLRTRARGSGTRPVRAARARELPTRRAHVAPRCRCAGELPGPFGAFSARVPAKPRRGRGMRGKREGVPADRQNRPVAKDAVLEIADIKKEPHGLFF